MLSVAWTLALPSNGLGRKSAPTTATADPVKVQLLQRQLAQQHPTIWYVLEVTIDAQASLDSKVGPRVRPQLRATIVLATSTFEVAEREGAFTFVYLVAQEEFDRSLHAFSTSPLRAGAYRTQFEAETPLEVELTGLPIAIISGRAIRIGSEKEHRLRAERQAQADARHAEAFTEQRGAAVAAKAPREANAVEAEARRRQAEAYAVAAARREVAAQAPRAQPREAEELLAAAEARSIAYARRVAAEAPEGTVYREAESQTAAHVAAAAEATASRQHEDTEVAVRRQREADKAETRQRQQQAHPVGSAQQGVVVEAARELARASNAARAVAEATRLADPRRVAADGPEAAAPPTVPTSPRRHSSTAWRGYVMARRRPTARPKAPRARQVVTFGQRRRDDGTPLRPHTFVRARGNPCMNTVDCGFTAPSTRFDAAGPRGLSRWLQRAAAAAFLLMIPGVQVQAQPQSIPASATGLWAQSPCGEATNTFLLVNTAFVMIVDTRGTETQVTVGPAQWAGSAVMLARPEGVALLPAVASLNRCPALPAAAYATFGEAITAFTTFDAVTQRCTSASARSCISAVFAAIDISNDRRLSVAEVNRAFRAAGFFLAYEAIVGNRPENRADPLGRLRVSLIELSASTLVTSIGAPFVTNAVMSAYDYNGDGFLSLEEILQDRGPLDAIPVGPGLSAVAAHAWLQTIIRALPGMASNIGGMLGGLLR